MFSTLKSSLDATLSFSAASHVPCIAFEVHVSGVGDSAVAGPMLGAARGGGCQSPRSSWGGLCRAELRSPGRKSDISVAVETGGETHPWQPAPHCREPCGPGQRAGDTQPLAPTAAGPGSCCCHPSRDARAPHPRGAASQRCCCGGQWHSLQCPVSGGCAAPQLCSAPCPGTQECTLSVYMCNREQT